MSVTPTGTSRPRIIDRPAALWIQGLVTGIAGTLFAVTLPIFLIDNSDGVVTLGTQALIYLSVAAFAGLFAVYVPPSWTGTTPAKTSSGSVPADQVDPMDRLAANY